jgi:hypothetical protein
MILSDKSNKKTYFQSTLSDVNYHTIKYCMHVSKMVYWRLNILLVMEVYEWNINMSATPDISHQ